MSIPGRLFNENPTCCTWFLNPPGYKEAYGLPFDMLAGNDPDLLRNYEVNYVPIIVFVGRDGNIRYLYHHYVLQEDFEASTAEIVSTP